MISQRDGEPYAPIFSYGLNYFFAKGGHGILLLQITQFVFMSLPRFLTALMPYQAGEPIYTLRPDSEFKLPQKVTHFDYIPIIYTLNK